ncbi:hypothetical protein BH09MYX1_BH09MYX1_53350 [soil metagenome]
MSADESKKKPDEEDEKDDADEAADEEESDEEESDEEESDEPDDEEASKENDEEDEEEEDAADEASSAEDDEEDDEEEDAEVAASPETIAKRAEALGDDDDESEKIAREEERKLAERRRKLKRRGGKSGLALAASKKLKKIGKNARPTAAKRRVPAAVEAADPLLERTARFGDWAKKNAKAMWIIVGLAAVSAMVFAGYSYYEKKRGQDASTELAAAVADEHVRIGEALKGDDDDVDTLHYFKTVEDRREAALSKYRTISSKFAGTGAATLARLGEGSLLLDKRDYDGAIPAFEEVKSSPLAAADTEVKGRALENLGFAHELRAQAKPETKATELDLALAAFKALEATDVAGFKELGMYHQARVLEAKGEVDKAKAMLQQLHDRFAQPDHGHQMDIIGIATDDRLRRLDPNALPPKHVNYGASGHPQISPEILNQLPPELRAKLMGGSE